MKEFASRIVVVIAAVFLLTSLIQVSSVKSTARSDVCFKGYSSTEDAFTALLNDEVDIMCYSLSYEQFENAQTNPNIQLASYDENGIFQFDVNNNYSIISYRNVRSPTNELKVRQAIAHLVNKSYITEDLLPKFWGETIDVPISNALSGWWNTSVTGSNYPYPYNPDVAAELLASLGFNDTDGNGYLNYPSDWPGIENLPSTDTQSMPLKILVRIDHEDRKKAGNYLIQQLEEVLANANWPSGFKGGGFATTGITYILPEDKLAPIITDRNYHIYTGGWSFSRFPPIGMYYMFHSNFWELGTNYVTDMEYPDLDEELEKAYYAQDISTAMFHCKNAQSLLVDKYCVSIWLWNYKYFNSYRKELAGVISHKSWGINNEYTYLNAYRADNISAPIRVAVLEPHQLNVLYSVWAQDWEILNVIYPTLLDVNPYDLAIDQPWVAQDWEVGTWTTGITDNSNVTYYIRKDVGIIAPETGQYVRNYTAHDVAFTIWYTYAFWDAWSWHNVMEAYDVDIINDYQIEVKFGCESLWLYEEIGSLPLLPKNEIIDKLCYITSEEFPAGVHQLSSPVVQVVNATLDDTLFVEDVDYDIVANWLTCTHNVFMPRAISSPESNVTIYYYTPRFIPTGYYLGSDYGLTWQDTMYSQGSHYPSSSPFDLKKNTYFFLDPPLGETDWRWIWDTPEGVPGWEIPGRDSGYYEISIYDVVKAAASYCHSGCGSYDPRYFPGADLDKTDLGHVGIYDIVTITGKYATKWGKPPNL